MNKNKLLLIECEMKGPKGHFLDNLIESTKSFEKKLKIYWILNKKFNNEGSYIPKYIKIFKSISTNKFYRKKNKFLYILEELFLFFANIYRILYFSLFFLKKKNFINFFIALKSNYFLLPKYFSSFYKTYISLKLSKKDHVFFQTARRKDMALINFLIKIDKDHPNFHIRVMLPPKIRFKGFFYYIKEIDKQLKLNRAFVYLFGDFTHKLFLKHSISKIGILKSNIPWSFYARKFKKKNHVIGFMGNARKAKGFHLLPELIKNLESKTNNLKYIIQFSKISDDLINTKKVLYEMAKNNKRILIIEKYCDYQQFRNILKRIDIMPIIHQANEINTITSGTMYSCLTHEIPIIIPEGTTFMNNTLKYKSFEKANSLRQYADKILQISVNYNYYLRNVKLNSKILRLILKNDPLKKNILS